MSLIAPTMPRAILRAFTTGLDDFLSPSDPLWSVMLKRFFALESYSLNLDKIINNLQDDLSCLVDQVGWRFLAADGDLYGGCHVGSVQPNLPPKLTGFSRDVEVITSVEQFNLLPNHPQIDKADYEPRILRITWLRFEAFWLHNRENGDCVDARDAGAAPPPPGSAQGAPQSSSYASEPPAKASTSPLAEDFLVPYIGFIPELPEDTYTHGILYAAKFVEALRKLALTRDSLVKSRPGKRSSQSFVPGLARH